MMVINYMRSFLGDACEVVRGPGKILALAGMCALAAVPTMAAESRPNILFIFSDDHALESISAYGSPLSEVIKTPNIDRIAKDGMVFTHLACNNSICSPSRASVMTGQYNHVNGVMALNGVIDKSSPWLSKELQRAGYQTWLVGKWHLESAPEGFDDYRVVKKQGTYFDPDYHGPDGLREKVQGYSSDRYTDLAIEWLEKRDVSKPFCMMLQFKAPHHPYDYPERLNSYMKGVTFPEPESLYEDLEVTSPRLKAKLFGQMDNARSYYDRHVNDVEPPMGKEGVDTHRGRVAASYQHMMLKYARCTKAVDENVGRMLDFLDQQGIGEQTIVIYCSDQGYWLGQHGLYDKRLILDESLKMPFIIRYPAVVKAGAENGDLCSNVDIAPTLLDLAGCSIPDSMQGRSMRGLLECREVEGWRDALWYNYVSGPDHYGIRTDRYTYVRFHGQEGIELYDNQLDPAQNASVHQNPEYADTIKMLEEKLQQVAKDVGVTPSMLKKQKKKPKKNDWFAK